MKRLLVAALLLLPSGCAQLLYPLDHRAPWTVDLSPIATIRLDHATYAVFPVAPRTVYRLVDGGRWTVATELADPVVSFRVAEGEVIATTEAGHDCCVPSGSPS